MFLYGFISLIISSNNIYLSNESFIQISFLEKSLLQYSINNFEKISKLVYSKNQSSVLVFNKDFKKPKLIEQQCFRWYKSYLNTPKRPKKISKSYMFSGKKEKEIDLLFPKELKPIFEYFYHKDNYYNQVVINLDKKNKDYIPLHSDWVEGMKENYLISLLNLYPKNFRNENHRFMYIVPNEKFKSEYPNKEFSLLSIKLHQGMIITFGGKFQEYFRHGVPPIIKDYNYSKNIKKDIREYSNPRLSFVFRQFRATGI